MTVNMDTRIALQNAQQLTDLNNMIQDQQRFRSLVLKVAKDNQVVMARRFLLTR